MTAVSFDTFYKVIVLNIDIFESEIVDERHFQDPGEARQYCDNVRKNGTNMAFVVKM